MVVICCYLFICSDQDVVLELEDRVIVMVQLFTTDGILPGTDSYLNNLYILCCVQALWEVLLLLYVYRAVCVSRLARLASSAAAPVLLQKASCQHVRKLTKAESYHILFTTLKILDKDLNLKQKRQSYV